MNRKTACAMAASVFALASCARMANQSAPISAAQKEAEAEAQLCRDMTKRAPAISQYPPVSQETALSDVKDANSRVGQAVQDVQKAARQVSDPGVMEVGAAYRSLQIVVDSIPGGRSTVGEASERISSGASQLQDAWNRLYTNLQCGA